MASFNLSDKENKKANSFIKRHKKCKPSNDDPLKMRRPYEYTFIPNGIGIAVYITCPYCNEKLDLTDVECW